MPYPKKQVLCTCEQCSTEFHVKASLAKSRRFCTWDCRVKHGKQSRIITHCQNCGKEIETYKKVNQKYCSINCGVSARNKTEQNPAYHRDISGENNPMYGKGHLLAGPNNPMYGKNGELNPTWKGGRKVRADGYILIYAPDHPYAISNGDGKNIYVLEHRLIMEKHLGRYLAPNEVVHHKDGNTSNNDIDNLELFSSQSEHISKGHG